VNFVTAHDGFTLRDLVSYNTKHNEANREENRDGSDNNHSWNCGAEGETDRADVLELRRRQARNFLATLLLSQGVPMLLAGDEFGRSQGGNNNAYCQDGEVSWIDWDGLDGDGRALSAFTRSLIKLRRDHLVFHRSRFFYGKTIPGTDVKDVTWLRPDGKEMTEADWGNAHGKALAVLLSGEAGLTHLTARGEQETDDTFLMLMNASHEKVVFKLPAGNGGARWTVVLDSGEADGEHVGKAYHSAKKIPVTARSMLVFVRETAPGKAGGQ
ncbi:MAG TPA: glycogen debranching enzyme GlgX, partial [Burkholderiales bacterium]|nr:glycogen debranching enzyme GlgX [Burkholderiales bacterium]